MSSFYGSDLFGSGPHQIVLGGEVVAKKRTGFAGCDGVESIVMGSRGRPVTITGLLKSNTKAGLNTLIGNIEDSILEDGARDLVDAFGCTYTYVELDHIELTSKTLYDGTNYMMTYVVTGRQVYR